MTKTGSSSCFGFVARARHALQDFRPVLGVLDHVTHAQEESLLAEITAPALAAIKLDVMAAAALGERMPFANGFDGCLKRRIAQARPAPECAIPFAPGTPGTAPIRTFVQTQNQE